MKWRGLTHLGEDMNMRRVLRVVLICLFMLIGGIALGPRVTLDEPSGPTWSLPAEVQAPQAVAEWLATQEAKVPTIREGLASQIHMAQPSAPAPTPRVLLFLHGFSASPLEVSPTFELVAAAQGANLMMMRLNGHGVSEEEMGAGKARAWMEDAENALVVAQRLGQKVVVAGSSTGASLALWLASRHPELEAVVLLSPNFGPKDPRSSLLLAPWGLQLLKLILGERRTWKPDNELVAARFTPSYPVDVLPQMMLVVQQLTPELLAKVQQPTLLLYSPHDTVLDTTQMAPRFAQLGAARKKLVVLDDVKQHVLGGDAYAPEATVRVVGEITSFLQALP